MIRIQQKLCRQLQWIVSAGSNGCIIILWGQLRLPKCCFWHWRAEVVFSSVRQHYGNSYPHRLIVLLESAIHFETRNATRGEFSLCSHVKKVSCCRKTTVETWVRAAEFTSWNLLSQSWPTIELTRQSKWGNNSNSPRKIFWARLLYF